MFCHIFGCHEKDEDLSIDSSAGHTNHFFHLKLCYVYRLGRVMKQFADCAIDFHYKKIRRPCVGESNNGSSNGGRQKGEERWALGIQRPEPPGSRRRYRFGHATPSAPSTAAPKWVGSALLTRPSASAGDVIVAPILSV